MSQEVDFLSPRARLDLTLDIFTEKLRPFVISQMDERFGRTWFNDKHIVHVLGGAALRGPSVLPHLDCQACLKLIDAYWKPVFQPVYRGDRGLLRVIRQLRNDLAHQESITEETVLYATSACSKCLMALGLPPLDLKIRGNKDLLRETIWRAQIGDLCVWIVLGSCSIWLLFLSKNLLVSQDLLRSWRLLCLILLATCSVGIVALRDQFSPRSNLGVRQRWLSAVGGSTLGIILASSYGLLLPLIIQNIPVPYGLDFRLVLAVLLGGLGSLVGQYLGIRRSFIVVFMVAFNMAISVPIGMLLIDQGYDISIGLWTGNICAYAGIGVTNCWLILRSFKGLLRWMSLLFSVLILMIFVAVFLF